MTASPDRFRDRSVTLSNGSVAHDVEVPPANPVNCHEAVSCAADMARVTIDGKRILPPQASRKGPRPPVILVAGSLGVAGSHLLRAATSFAAI